MYLYTYSKLQVQLGSPQCFQLPRTTYANISHQKIRSTLTGVIGLIHRSSIIEAGTDSPDFSDPISTTTVEMKVFMHFCTTVVSAVSESNPSSGKDRKCVITKISTDHYSMFACWIVNKDSALRSHIGQCVVSLVAFFCGILTTFNFYFYQISISSLCKNWFISSSNKSSLATSTPLRCPNTSPQKIFLCIRTHRVICWISKVKVLYHKVL